MTTPEIQAQLHEQANTIIDTASRWSGVALVPLSPLRLALRREIADAIQAERAGRQAAEQDRDDLRTVLAEAARVDQAWQDCDDCDHSSWCEVHEIAWDRVHAERHRLLSGQAQGHVSDYIGRVRAAFEGIESWPDEPGFEDLQEAIDSMITDLAKG